ncbi:MAG TPA: ABC transporter permease [Clostridiales bacterium]|nr:ABC transporter permease [Clostridiales bacterium]
MYRIAQKTGVSNKRAALYRLIGIIGALVVSSIFILIAKKNPLQVYTSMINGAFGSYHRIRSIIIKAIPLAITSFGISVAFKLRFWNIGGEGQIMMGAFGAAWVALSFPDLSKPLLLLIMALTGFVFGGLYALIPAFFKGKFNTNETLFTLMMNYIAIKWVTYLQYNAWKDPSGMGFPKIADFSQNAWLPQVFGIHIGWIVTLVLAVVMHIFIKHSKKGYEISVVGESVNTARYAGMNYKKIMLQALFLSGGLCGLAGMIQASGVGRTLSVTTSAGAGFTAIIIAWLSRLSMPVMVVVAFLFGAMVQGGVYIETAYQIPQAVTSIIQGMILFFVLGTEFFIRYKIVPIKKEQEQGGKE